MPTSRRSAIQSILLGTAGAALGLIGEARASRFEVEHSDAEWRKILSPLAYDVMRHQGTEPSWSSPLESEHRKGLYSCAGCGLGLFASETKFDSGTGWPSFFRPLQGVVQTTEDRSLFESRTEVH